MAITDNTATRFAAYLLALEKPFKKRVRLDFLQPDGSVAFSLGNGVNSRYLSAHDSRAFIQDGSLSVNLQNGMRRQAKVTLANADGAFSYNVNNLWLGQRVRLLMGLELPNGKDFLLPQGVFYIKTPENVMAPTEQTVILPLVDKWAYLDGSLFGTLDGIYQIFEEKDGTKTDIFNAMRSVLRLSKIDYSDNAPQGQCIDDIAPIFTTYYNGKTYALSDGSTAAMTNVPYDMSFQTGGSFAEVMLELAEVVAALIGYDCTGALRVDASQDDIDDGTKPVLWRFTPENSQLLGLTESVQNAEICNDVLIVGEGLNDVEVWGRAANLDPKSDTNINLIGRRLFYEAKANYWNSTQCADLASFYLKRKTVLQKAVTVQCSQMFHLQEGDLVTVVRTDKAGSPAEKHLIQSISLPISESGEMTLSCISASDLPELLTVTSSSDDN